jgi:hypothetical protein
MGLLDDAIRDHLELKRRRGADPGEVAREQREALNGAFAAPADGTDEPAPPPVAYEPAAAVPASSAEDDPVGGETAELDMSTVLSDDHADATPAALEEESLEWEMPVRGGMPAADDPSPPAVHE